MTRVFNCFMFAIIALSIYRVYVLLMRMVAYGHVDFVVTVVLFAVGLVIFMMVIRWDSRRGP